MSAPAPPRHEPAGRGRPSSRSAPSARGSAERLALPLHLRPVAAALFDDLAPRPQDDVADAALAGLERGRAELASLVPAGEELTVDAFRVRRTAGCPATATPDAEAFRWMPASAARHLGLRALALHLRGDTWRPVEQAVEAVVAEQVASGGDRTPGPWLAGLDPAGRAVARATAQRWAEQAVDWLPLRLVEPRALRFLGEDWWPGGARGGRTLVVHGRRDLTVDLDGRRVAVTMAGGTAGDVGGADADAFTALAATLCDPRGRLVRVVRVHPASGEVVPVDVTEGLLDRGVSVVLGTASALAAARRGAEMTTTPGPGCAWCDRRHRCPPGITWCRTTSRSMGLPLPVPA